MPARDFFQISPVKGGTDTDLNNLVVQINRANLAIAAQLAKLEGLGGQLVKLRGDLDLGGKRVRSVGSPSAEGDVAARGVVAQQGALSRATQERIVVTHVIEAHEGLTTPDAIYGTQGPSLSQVQDEATLVTISTAQTITGQKTFSGGIVIGSGGTAITKVLSATAVLDFPNTLTLTSSDLAIALTGAVLGDTVLLGVPNGSVNANSAFTAWVDSAGSVTVRFNNYSALAINPASGTFRVAVVQF